MRNESKAIFAVLCIFTSFIVIYYINNAFHIVPVYFARDTFLKDNRSLDSLKREKYFHLNSTGSTNISSSTLPLANEVQISPADKRLEKLSKYFHSDANYWLDDWTKVTEDVYVYSAYTEQRMSKKKSNKTQAIIRFVAIVPREKLTILKCVVPNSDSRKWIIQQAIVEVIREHHELTYAAAFLWCITPFSKSPTEIGLQTVDSGLKIPVMLSVHRPPLEHSQKGELAICVRPFFGPFKDTKKLAEFIAYYDFMGVNHFTFYDYNTSSDVRRFLHVLYTEGESIDFLPWSLPNAVKPVHEFGQVASLQDCVYRHMFDFNYILLVDIDEFLVPRFQQSLVDLIRYLNLSTKKSIGSYVFRQSFFCVDDELASTEMETNGSIFPLMIQRYTIREKYIWPVGKRSKMIIRPHAVYTAGVHQMWKKIGDYESLKVPSEVALLHHYRDSGCENGSLVEDTSATAYISYLRNSRILGLWQDVFIK